MTSLSDFLEQSGPNSGFIRELYDLYLQDPALVGDSWASIFGGLNGTSNGHAAAVATNGHAAHAVDAGGDLTAQARVDRLIASYRQWGHLRARINPLKSAAPRPDSSDLNVNAYGFSPDDQRAQFACDHLSGRSTMALRDIIATLEEAYCGTVGFEFTHISNVEARNWLRDRIESRRAELTREAKIRAFTKLVEAEEFEAQLHKKYVGQKRFSLQGGESMIPMLDVILQRAAREGISRVVMGMAHRGRLNVLCNIVGKPLEDLFSEFEDQSTASTFGAGDVKYHKGYHSTYTAPNGGGLEVELAPNPSHLEFVNPVVEGAVRAYQDANGRDRKSVLPVLMHGDAAFVGQGVVPETLNLAALEGYATGGTVHIITNNQVGFTTNPDDARSCIYCTDMAKAFDAPVFHVNGDDVDACLWVSELAVDYRNRYGRDAVIDLYCYRKYGHNEGDDPSFTQPVVYAEIQEKKSVARLYGEQLASDGAMSADEVKASFESYTKRFHSSHGTKNVAAIGQACSLFGRLRVAAPETRVDGDTLAEVAQTLITYPAGFTVHSKLHTILEKRVQALKDGKGIDWGFAEALAFGSLVKSGRHVRLSGQDCGRGTFSHRHLALRDNKTGARHLPLSALESAGGKFEVYNSSLSEAAVVGFEFGYATVDREALVLWEAQFGDFANGAQVHIDQFIAASEAKWDQLSGVVMLLPHGYEGQGPEHSSARLERFLQLSAEGNMVVCYPSNAAQYFHMLRRQALSDTKRPLVVMTPKSLLRLPEAAATTTDLTEGQFQPVIEEVLGSGTPKHVVMCTGKIYYDIMAGLRKLAKPSVKVIRIEQLHPFPQFELKRALKDIDRASYLWVQEEPQNMGAWTYLEAYLKEKLGVRAEFVGRPAAASPAAGSLKRHTMEQQWIVEDLVERVS